MVNTARIKLDRKLFEKHHVSLVLLFGSGVTGAQHPGSDVDIGVLFADDRPRRLHPVAVYGDLQEEFSKLSTKGEIDLVYLVETPLALQFKAIRDGVLLYEATPVAFANYKEKVMNAYFDFKFFEDIMNEPFRRAART